jgi:hypothetical protein
LKFKGKYFIVLVLVFQNVWTQQKFDNFFKPSDSLHKKRQNSVYIAEAVLASATLVGLHQLWYADYPKSNFHFVNDNGQWLQMDKLGHVYSSYQIGRLGAEALHWSGTSKKKQLLYGASLGFVFLTAVEVMDGFSEEWGASIGDVVANATGTALYVSQELLWNEQRIIPKFSYHKTKYAEYSPNVLGKTVNEQILKDYNGQTYWFSLNLYSFAKASQIPKWLNLAFGYGGEGMISENPVHLHSFSSSKPDKYRQFYLSIDLDLTKIGTKSHFLRTIFSVFNSLKIPAPTIEYSPKSGFKGYVFYF